MNIVTENQLDVWVRGNARDAQGVIAELVWRLVAASCPSPKERRFPLADSIGQHGPDGILNVDLPFDPFVPEGRSFWEIGTGVDSNDKATKDYNRLVRDLPPAVRIDSTFVFVTPLSGTRNWEHTWKDGAQATWIEKRKDQGDWKDVRVIDGTRLIDWIHQFPPVEMWLADQMSGLPTQKMETPEQRWRLIRCIGEPPRLTPQVFLANREEAYSKVKEVFTGASVQLKLATHFPDQVADFVAAYLASLEQESSVDAAGRCLLISGTDAWNAIVAEHQKLFLVADIGLDLSGESGTKLIQKARRSGHAVIFGGSPGGIPDPASAVLPSPRSHQLKEALVQAGYTEERARTLAQKSGGHLGSFLRCVQNLSLIPAWAEGSPAADLAVASLLGAWVEDSDADRAVVEAVTGKSYGEWIAGMRDVALRTGTPLTHWDGTWKFLARYEGWHALGPRLFDEHLDRLQRAATSVLQEPDPQFELPKEERYAAGVYGKALKHSHLLRNGLAESLALLGSHPKALTSCTLGKPLRTASLAVRAILVDGSWLRWASLDDLLPLLAEASPTEFLDAVEKTLDTDPCPFDEVFNQESDAWMGRTHMSGLLWALETLAWDADYLSRVMVCMGQLAARDPGGRWANRPANSLTTILLPWLPQTCSPIPRRIAAVASLLAQLPDTGWKLLLSLLPQSHSTSLGSRRPAWREIIPEDWSNRVTQQEYWEQVTRYAEMAVSAAKTDLTKLATLIDHMDRLPPVAREHLLTHLGSDTITTMSESSRIDLWTQLADLVTQHRKFAKAAWAMDPAEVATIAALAERLAPQAPALRHRRLFTERDFNLYDETGKFEEQAKILEARRHSAVEEIAAAGGVQAVLAFADAVESPWRVGCAFGITAASEVDGLVLPDLLESQQKSLVQFSSGFVWGRFQKREWNWVDGVDTSGWTPDQIGQFLSFLPFRSETWKQSSRLLGEDESAYWSRASANPFDAEAGIETAIDQLIRYGRPCAAIRCLYKLLYDKHPLDKSMTVRALLAAPQSSERLHSHDAYEIVEIISTLQNDPSMNPDDLFRVEWAFLPLMDEHRGASPKLLCRRLAQEPEFFCEVIRLVFRSKKIDLSAEEPSEEEKSIAKNAYRLLDRWRTPPGYREDGTFDGDALDSWLEAVKKKCSESGHLEIAMTMVGHVLVHVPADPGGLWIHRSAAAALNSKDAGDIRNGFRAELFNSRGVHQVDPTGRPERQLAEKYRGLAEAIEGAGYHRVATMLRELAESYDRAAERVSSRDHIDD